MLHAAVDALGDPVATGHGKTACNFLGAIYWIASAISLN